MMDRTRRNINEDAKLELKDRERKEKLETCDEKLELEGEEKASERS